MGHPRPLFPFIFVFSHSTNTEKWIEDSWDQTRIVGPVGENADHFTTTTALYESIFVHLFVFNCFLMLPSSDTLIFI